jgi:hypothetical protein
MTTADNDLSGRELEPAFGRSLPAPHTLVGMLRERLEARVIELRAERGDVHAPEDVFVSVRNLGAIAEGLADYGAAFTTVAKETRGYIQDDLELAVGEQDGVPLSGMTVPDTDGTNLKISLDTANEYNIDTDTVMSGVAHLVVTTNPVSQLLTAVVDEDKPRTVDMIVELLTDAMTTLLACGQFKPQVTKVREMATEIARTDPKVASTITGVLKHAKTTRFRGVKVKREPGK